MSSPNRDLTGIVTGPQDLPTGMRPCEALEVGSQRQLFIDDRFVQCCRGVRLQMNPAVKLGPVLRPEAPWEMSMGFCASVIEYEGEFRLYYRCENFDDTANVCLALSEDGLRWERPTLRVCDVGGSSDNNVVMTDVHETVVFLDPHGRPEERFKMVAMHKWPDPVEGGIVCHTSADGIHWNQGPRVLDIAPDTANQAAWDRQRGKYVAYLRKWDPLRKIGRIETDDILQPWPYESLGEDAYFVWGRDKIPVPTREFPTAFGYDELDPVESDHYNPAAVEYPFAQSVYFMFPSPYMHHPPPPNDGLLDIQLAVSRDGVEFHRPERRPYVSLGMPDEVDSQRLYMAVGLVRRGNWLYQYYGGYEISHGKGAETRRAKKRFGSICALRQRIDGFVSVDADFTGGIFVTPPVKFEGERLVLNIDCSALGGCRVGLLDAGGRPIPGFTPDDCDVIYANNPSRTVTWAGSPDVSGFAGKPVRLCFVMRSAKLYAFEFVARR
ncbi:MAG: hypothetical protein HPY44_07820 [Armatimonadetes bacterium]|nr:hypothetical protein [Armatimonadota bacterium]